MLRSNRYEEFIATFISVGIEVDFLSMTTHSLDEMNSHIEVCKNAICHSKLILR